MKTDWKGKFGNDYTDRNTPDVGTRYRILKQILQDIVCDPYNILEVGCNKGVNLFAIQVLYPDANVEGSEINREILKFGIDPFIIRRSIIKYSTYNLVFTCGVLIHVDPMRLKQTMQNIIDASTRYVLAIEYYAPKEIEVEYQGKRNMLWKRDYGKLYQDLGLNLISTGEVPEIDNCTYWLFKK